MAGLMAGLMWMIVIVAIVVLLVAFVFLCAAVFNWMHAGTADFWEVAGFKEREIDKEPDVG